MEILLLFYVAQVPSWISQNVYKTAGAISDLFQHNVHNYSSDQCLIIDHLCRKEMYK